MPSSFASQPYLVSRSRCPSHPLFIKPNFHISSISLSLPSYFHNISPHAASPDRSLVTPKMRPRSLAPPTHTERKKKTHSGELGKSFSLTLTLHPFTPIHAVFFHVFWCVRAGGVNSEEKKEWTSLVTT